MVRRSRCLPAGAARCAATSRRGTDGTAHEDHDGPQNTSVIFKGWVLEHMHDVKCHQAEHDEHSAKTRDHEVREKMWGLLLVEARHHREKDRTHKKDHVDNGPKRDDPDDYRERFT